MVLRKVGIYELFSTIVAAVILFATTVAIFSGSSGVTSRTLHPSVMQRQAMDGFIRPDAVVLPEKAIVPDRNLISPAPNQFTHKLIRPQPFYFTGAQQAMQPDGQFPAGTKVVLLVYNGGNYCRVADGQGLYVEIEYDSLRKL